MVAGETVQRGHNYAVVDEVDRFSWTRRVPSSSAGLLSRVRSGTASSASLVPRLRRDTDYEVDEKKRTVGILESGVEKIEDHLGIDNLYEAVNTPLVGYLNNALKAKELYRRDKDYVVMEGEVLIVDEHTGRILRGRRYNEGMHQAIEAKENVKIKDENQTLATITVQNYFRLYDKLAGMTGTAKTEGRSSTRSARRIDPANMPMIGDHRPHPHRRPQGSGAVVGRHRRTPQPGQRRYRCTVMWKSSTVGHGAKPASAVPHAVPQREVPRAWRRPIVAQAGTSAQVQSPPTTWPMAGIMLGGNQFCAPRRAGAAADSIRSTRRRTTTTGRRAQRLLRSRGRARRGRGARRPVRPRHRRRESRRIDNQLRGRSGRQGDPGESALLPVLAGRPDAAVQVERRRHRDDAFKVPDDVLIEAKMVTNAIASAQHLIEQQHFEIRKNVLKYDEVLNRQRQVIYAEGAVAFSREPTCTSRCSTCSTT